MDLKLLRLLKGIDTIAVDTAPFIYYIEEHKDYIETIAPLFTLISQGRIIAYTSVITLIEVLAKPIQEKNEKLIAGYHELLTNSNNLILTEIDKNMAVETAKLKSKYHIRIPDALQIACGLMNDAKAFVTNDGNLKKVKEMRIVVLDDLVK